MPENIAWPTAKNVVKKGCLTGDLNFKGIQHMKDVSRAKFCKAYQEYLRRNKSAK